MTYEIENREIQQLLRILAQDIGSALPDGWGFNLLLFEHGEGGSFFYISDTNRKDVIKLMKEWIRKNE